MVADARSPLRHATIRAGEGPSPLELTVAVLPHQDHRRNFARWASQAGLSPFGPQHLDRALSHTDANGLPVDVVDLDGPASRILAALVDHEGRTWAFKISGSSKQVGAQKKAFRSFVRSVRFEPTGAP